MTVPLERSVQLKTGSERQTDTSNLWTRVALPSSNTFPPSYQCRAEDTKAWSPDLQMTDAHSGRGRPHVTHSSLGAAPSQSRLPRLGSPGRGLSTLNF